MANCSECSQKSGFFSGSNCDYPDCDYVICKNCYPSQLQECNIHNEEFCKEHFEPHNKEEHSETDSEEEIEDTAEEEATIIISYDDGGDSAEFEYNSLKEAKADYKKIKLAIEEKQEWIEIQNSLIKLNKILKVDLQ